MCLNDGQLKFWHQSELHQLHRMQQQRDIALTPINWHVYLHSCRHPGGSETQCGRSPGVSLWEPAHTSWPAHPGWIHGGKPAHAAAPPGDEPPPEKHTQDKHFITVTHSLKFGQRTHSESSKPTNLVLKLYVAEALRWSTFFMYSVTGFCCRNSVLSRV